MQVRIINYTSPTAAADFAAGLKEIGFAVVSHHPIAPTLIDDAYRVWGDFFHSNIKDQFSYSEEDHDGFISASRSETAKGYDKKDLKEFYHYYAGKRCPDSCKAVTEKLFQELTAMASTLLGWVQTASPTEVQSKFSIPLPEMIKSSKNILFRPIHYPPLTGHEAPGALRSADHEDINLLTLLPAATAEGLQVKDSKGNWLDVPINPGWIIVNVGDMLQEASGHYYPSTTHRVLNPTGEAAKKSRLSMPLFLHPRDEVVLSERHTRLSYYQERMRELGLVKS